MRFAVGILLQNMSSSAFCVLPVIVADEAVEAMVAVSRVCEEVWESDGDREFPPRPPCRKAGVVKDLGSVEDGRALCWALKPEAVPKLWVVFLGVRVLPLDGIASSCVGGTPRYSSA